MGHLSKPSQLPEHSGLEAVTPWCRVVPCLLEAGVVGLWEGEIDFPAPGHTPQFHFVLDPANCVAGPVIDIPMIAKQPR